MTYFSLKRITLILIILLTGLSIQAQIIADDEKIIIGEDLTNSTLKHGITLNGFNALHWEYGQSTLHIQLANFSKVLIGSNEQIYFYNQATNKYNDLWMQYLMTSDNGPRVDTPDIYDEDPIRAINKITSLNPLKRKVGVSKSKKNSSAQNTYIFDGRELSKLIPEAVKSDGDTAYLINPNAILPHIILSLQHLTGKVCENEAALSILSKESSSKSSPIAKIIKFETSEDIAIFDIAANPADDLRLIFSNISGTIESSFKISPGLNSIPINKLSGGIHIATLICNAEYSNSVRFSR